MTTRRHTRQMKCGRGGLPLIPTLVRERGGDRASVQERPGILGGGGPISEQNVEVVRRVFELNQEAMPRGDFDAAFDEAVREGILASNLKWRLSPRVPVAGIENFDGRDGYVEFMRRWSEDFDDFRIEAEEVIGVAGDRVVATVYQSGTGKGSGAAVELRTGAVYTFEAGRIVQVELFPDRDHALWAVGLGE